ncbi:MAG: DUF3416 domain-containing protein, partial [Pirellulales bacterium]|nr:DUF3416 domain-containing protein [Pirellulales bacterium]
MTASASQLLAHHRRRVAIERVSPDVDAGQFAVKRVVGDVVTVAADIVCDGHDELDCRLHVRHGDRGRWRVVPLVDIGNDRWEANFTVDALGAWQYTVSGRV